MSHAKVRPDQTAPPAGGAAERPERGRGRGRRRWRRSDSSAPTGLLLEAVTHYSRGLYRLRRGNEVSLLRAGAETFPAMLAAIAAARRSICLETYIIEDDATGTRFADALIERARNQVVVRVIYDSLGGFGMSDEFVDRLRDAGVQLVEYHPLAPWRKRFNLSRRDHRKILVVDDQIGFTGGLNISDDYADVADGGVGWHDMHCQLRGPVVADLARLFRRVWLREGGAPYPAPPSAEYVTDHPGALAARVVDNAKRRRRGAIRRAYVTAINAARRSILLENAYFLPDRRLRRVLDRAVARGVEVCVLVPGRSDVTTIEYAGLYVYRKMVKSGVRILRWQGPMMHAKTAVIDGVWSAIGSYNLDARSLMYNLEVIVEIIDEDFGAIMERQFRADQVNSVPFDRDDWHRLSWWRKGLAWLAFRVRNWL